MRSCRTAVLSYDDAAKPLRSSEPCHRARVAIHASCRRVAELGSLIGHPMLLVTTSIFADHHQFYVFDSNFDHFKDPDLVWTASRSLAYGYLASKRAIYVSTVASLNLHRLRIFLNEAPVLKYERVFSSDLLITSRVLKISAPANAPEDDVQIHLPCGAYRVSVCSSAIGVDERVLYPDRDEPMSDEELFTHDDLEYYDLFVQPH